MPTSAPGKLWGGRFTGTILYSTWEHHKYSLIYLTSRAGGLDPLMTKYNESIYYDRVFYLQDIAGSIAWARANQKAGILSQDEFKTIQKGLLEVEKEWVDGTFDIQPGVDEVGGTHSGVRRDF